MGEATPAGAAAKSIWKPSDEVVETNETNNGMYLRTLKAAINSLNDLQR